MPKSDQPRLQIVVTEQTHSQLKQIAEKHQENGNLSDFVRDAVERRCRELGYEVNLSVNTWGGHRGKNRKSTSVKK